MTRNVCVVCFLNTCQDSCTACPCTACAQDVDRWWRGSAKLAKTLEGAPLDVATQVRQLHVQDVFWGLSTLQYPLVSSS